MTIVYNFTEMQALCILAIGLGGFPHTRAQEFDFGLVTTAPTTTAVFYAPNPGHDAYWVGGHWVFGRTRTTATTGTKSRLRVINAERMLVCGRPCARVYRKLTGKVCVHKLDNVYDPKYDGHWVQAQTQGFIDWRNGGVLDRNYDYLRTFDSYCQFLDAQCRIDIYHGYGYAFLHMGPCLRDEKVFGNLMHAPDIVASKKTALANYKYQMDYLWSGKSSLDCMFILLFLELSYARNNNWSE